MLSFSEALIRLLAIMLCGFGLWRVWYRGADPTAIGAMIVGTLTIALHPAISPAIEYETRRPFALMYGWLVAWGLLLANGAVARHLRKSGNATTWEFHRDTANALASLILSAGLLWAAFARQPLVFQPRFGGYGQWLGVAAGPTFMVLVAWVCALPGVRAATWSRSGRKVAARVVYLMPVGAMLVATRLVPVLPRHWVWVLALVTMLIGGALFARQIKGPAPVTLSQRFRRVAPIAFPAAFATLACAWAKDAGGLAVALVPLGVVLYALKEKVLSIWLALLLVCGVALASEVSFTNVGERLEAFTDSRETIRQVVYARFQLANGGLLGGAELPSGRVSGLDLPHQDGASVGMGAVTGSAVVLIWIAAYGLVAFRLLREHGPGVRHFLSMAAGITLMLLAFLNIGWFVGVAPLVGVGAAFSFGPVLAAIPVVLIAPALGALPREERPVPRRRGLEWIAVVVPGVLGLLVLYNATLARSSLRGRVVPNYSLEFALEQALNDGHLSARHDQVIYKHGLSRETWNTRQVRQAIKDRLIVAEGTEIRISPIPALVNPSDAGRALSRLQSEQP